MERNVRLKLIQEWRSSNRRMHTIFDERGHIPGDQIAASKNEVRSLLAEMDEVKATLREDRTAAGRR